VALTKAEPQRIASRRPSGPERDGALPRRTNREVSIIDAAGSSSWRSRRVPVDDMADLERVLKCTAGQRL